MPTYSNQMPSRACAFINLAPNYLPPVWVLTSPAVWTLSSACVLLCCVSALQPQPRHHQRRQSFLQQKVPSARATTMFLLLMPSLPIKSATVNYCNYESELSVCPPSPLLWSPSLHGVWRNYGSWCAASLGPRLCSVEALAGNWMRSGGQTRCTWQGWCEGDCTVHAG